MKERRVFAFSIIFLLVFNFFFIANLVLLPHLRNPQIPEGNPRSSGQNLRVLSDSDNIFEFYSNYNSDFAPLRIVTFVGQNSTGYDENFAYLAAIPVGLYNENDVLKVSPILYDDLDFAQEYFLTDWKNYCQKFDSWDGIKNIIYIGNVATETKNTAEGLLNPQFTPVQLGGANTYELAAQIATYFWYRPDVVVIAAINETFPDPQSILLNYSGSLDGNVIVTRSGEINGTHLENFWSNTNLILDSGGILVEINNTADLAMDLFGNFSESTPWMYDTNKISNTNWVFFPNASYPANMSDWGLRIYNTTDISTPIVYDLNFTTLTYETHQIEINNSESQLDILLNWTNPIDDLNFWLLDPSYQLIAASSRTGNVYESGEIEEFSSILYPEKGNWTILITRTAGVNPIPYNLTVNVTEFSVYRRQCIESAANGAVIASLLTKPLLYVTNSTVPNATKQALSTLNASRAILVDPYNLMTGQVMGDLTALNVNLALSTNLTSKTMLYEYIYNLTQEPDVVLSSVNEGYFGPASLLAAYHGAPVSFTLDESYNIHAGALKNYASDYWIGFQNPGESAVLNQSIPRFQDMKGLADLFYGWMSSMNLDKAGNETVLVVSPISELNPFFDRAIYGKAFVGRFAAQNVEDLAVFVCRNILYPALSYVNLSYKYELQNKIVSCDGNATITGMQLYATNFTGDHSACHLNDETYHTYYNASNGQIVMAYYVNLSDSLILYENITQIDISMEGKIGYSNESIQVAGWGIWNWTAGSYQLIDATILNSTIDQFDSILIDNTNKSSLILPTDSRIEIFILVNVTSPPVNVSIDFIQFNVTYYQLLNDPLMLSSSVSYWHNFTFQGSTYNFSSLIPENFTQNGYQVANLTGYQEIYSQLADNCKLWYYSGKSTLPQNEFGAQGNISFTLNDYWRAFGDSDDQGATPGNPDADGDHIVTPNTTLAKWQTGFEFNMFLSHLPSSFILLQDGYLGATLMPEYLMLHGATAVIAGLKPNVLGYSEYLSYTLLNKLLSDQPLGKALYVAFNQTSHLYSQNWAGNILGFEPFSNFTEENQQFILYGDPELNLLNTTYNLPAPTSYRPLIHEFANYTFLDWTTAIIANISDLDSDLNTDVFAKFNITGTDYEGHEDFVFYQTNRATTYSDGLFAGSTRFLNNSHWPYESLGWKTVEWLIYDSDNEIQLNVPVYLRSKPPIFEEITIQLNDTGVFNDIDHVGPPLHEIIGRVNESIYIGLKIRDVDQDKNDPDSDEFEVNVTFTNMVDYSTFTLQLNFDDDYDEEDIYSYWNCTYNFDAFKPTGRYYITLLVEDGGECPGDAGKEIYMYYDYDYFDVINWAPEANGTNFVITNGTGVDRQVFRMNETLEVYASVFDVDRGRTRTISCEGNETITGTQLNATNFSGTHATCQYNDEMYHTYYTNSSGQIVMAYYVNFSDFNTLYQSISQIDISIEGKIGYSNESIQLAGWGLWNWTAESYQLINTSLFNSTLDKSDRVTIDYSNKSNFILQNNSRIEVFILVNTSGPSLNVSIDYIWFNVTYLQDVTLCLYKESNQWINMTMIDDDFDDNWTSNYVFTPFDEPGVWFPYIRVTDKDNLMVFLQPNTNITVVNMPPNPPFDLATRNLTQFDISAVFRNVTIQFFVNATDDDVAYRTSNLTVYACLKDPSGIIRYEEVMIYDNETDQWIYNFTPQTTDPIGNWTYYVSVVDEANGRTNSTELINLTILNNMPVIQAIDIFPAGGELYIGEPLSITGNVFDVEQLDNIIVFIEDGDGVTINSSQILVGNSSAFEIIFEWADYAALKTTGTWNITIKLYDGDGNYTGEFTVGAENDSVIIVVHPRQEDNPVRFPIEIIIIIAIIVTTVLATYLVYRTRKKEATVIPAARVKQIIKKISKEKEEKIAKAKEDIKVRIKAIDIKPKPQIAILPAQKKELTEEEKDKANKEMRKAVKEAQELLEENHFEAAAVAYHDAAKLALKLEKHEIARVYTNKGEEILQKKAELMKKSKAKAKDVKKKKKTRRKAKEGLSQVEIENVKTEIGELMRKARKAMRGKNYPLAAEQYKEVANLYRKIFDEEKAQEFEEKANEL